MASRRAFRNLSVFPPPECKLPKGLARETRLVIRDGGACTSRDCTKKARCGMEMGFERQGL